MTDQARKRAEEYANKKLLLGPQKYSNEVEKIYRERAITDHMAGAASALEEIGKVEVSGAKKFWLEEVQTSDDQHYAVHETKPPNDYPECVLVEVIIASPALLEIATLRAQLEKTANNLRAISRSVKRQSPTAIEIMLDANIAELEALK